MTIPHVQRSRKDRRCDGCAQVIPKGATYYATQESDDQGFRGPHAYGYWYLCLACAAIGASWGG